MNLVLAASSPTRRKRPRAFVFAVMLAINLAGVAGIALYPAQPHGVAFGVTSLALLLAALA